MVCLTTAQRLIVHHDMREKLERLESHDVFLILDEVDHSVETLEDCSIEVQTTVSFDLVGSSLDLIKLA